MKNLRQTATALAARAFGSAPFNWTYSRALEHEERALIAALGVGPGMRVLDVACGGAANTFYFADAVAPGGEVVGIDRDPAHIAFAEMQKAGWAGGTADHVSFRVADAEVLPEDLSRFDVIWLSQVAMFFHDPVAVLQRLAKRHLKPGGALVVRGWLDSAEQYHDFQIAPFPPGLMARFQEAYNTAVNYSLTKRLAPVPESSQVSVIGLLEAAGLASIQVLPQSIRRQPPFSGWDHRFLHGRLRWMIGASGVDAYLAPVDHARLTELADQNHPDFVLRYPDFVYQSFGLAGIGWKPGGKAVLSSPAERSVLGDERPGKDALAYYIPYRLGPHFGLMDRLNAALKKRFGLSPTLGQNDRQGPTTILRQPVSPEDRRKLQAVWDQLRADDELRQMLSSDDWQTFCELTDPDNPRYLLNRSDFLYVQFEHMRRGES